MSYDELVAATLAAAEAEARKSPLYRTDRDEAMSLAGWATAKAIAACPSVVAVTAKFARTTVRRGLIDHFRKHRPACAEPEFLAAFGSDPWDATDARIDVGAALARARRDDRRMAVAIRSGESARQATTDLGMADTRWQEARGRLAKLLRDYRPT